jgi:hypothetical protein
MTLDNLLRIGKLRAHAADRAEIARLLDAAERAVSDAAVPDVSAGTRLDAAYRAIMQAALVAMLANGYRPITSEAGHHQLLIQALPKTAGIDPDRVRVLDAYRAARNQSDYRGVAVSDSVVDECRDEAVALLQHVREWIASNRPQLL